MWDKESTVINKARVKVCFTCVCAIVSFELAGFGKGFVTGRAFEHFGFLRVHFGSLLMDILVLL